MPQMYDIATPPKTERPPISLTMDYQQACKVIWPFNKEAGRGPMGAMFARGEIAGRDLGWASTEPNMDPKIREAARAILAHSWAAPVSAASPSDRPGPQVVSGSTYLQRMERANLAAAAGLLGFAAGLLVQPLLNTLDYIRKGNVSLSVLLVAGAIFAASLWMVYRETSKYYKAYKNFTKGREGEAAVLQHVLAVLDGRWTVFRNLQLGRGEDDIDLVLVGPGQVWAVEVKTYKQSTRVNGQYQPKGSRWTRKKRGKRPPDAQAFDKAIRLKNYLKQKGIPNPFVRAAVAFPEFSPSDLAPRSDVSIWHQIDLDQNLYQMNTVPGPVRQEDRKTVEVLQSLIKHR